MQHFTVYYTLFYYIDIMMSLLITQNCLWGSIWWWLSITIIIRGQTNERPLTFIEYLEQAAFVFRIGLDPGLGPYWANPNLYHELYQTVLGLDYFNTNDLFRIQTLVDLQMYDNVKMLYVQLYTDSIVHTNTIEGHYRSSSQWRQPPPPPPGHSRP